MHQYDQMGRGEFFLFSLHIDGIVGVALIQVTQRHTFGRGSGLAELAELESTATCDVPDADRPAGSAPLQGDL